MSIQSHKTRISNVALSRGKVIVNNGTIRFENKHESTNLPIENISCLLLEPGTSITHEAVKICADNQCSIQWIGEEGVRFYSNTINSSIRADRLWKQASMAINKNKRLSVARRMYKYRFGNNFNVSTRSIHKMSGLEGIKIKQLYRDLADEHSMTWPGRHFESTGDANIDNINLALNTANSCMYGISEVAIQLAGYSPHFGFIHGKTNSAFVLDIADLFKFKTVTRIAFDVVSKDIPDIATATRHMCRDLFRQTRIVNHIISAIDHVIGYEECQANESPAILEPFEFWNDHVSSIVKEKLARS